MEVLPKSYLHTLREAEEIRMDSTILLLETPEMKTVGVNTVALPIHRH